MAVLSDLSVKIVLSKISTKSVIRPERDNELVPFESWDKRSAINVKIELVQLSEIYIFKFSELTIE